MFYDLGEWVLGFAEESLVRVPAQLVRHGGQLQGLIHCLKCCRIGWGAGGDCGEQGSNICPKANQSVCADFVKLGVLPSQVALDQPGRGQLRLGQSIKALTTWESGNGIRQVQRGVGVRPRCWVQGDRSGQLIRHISNGNSCKYP